MPGVHVVTDSACDLSDELSASSGIIVVPLTIRFGTEEFEDRRDITPSEFWRRCKAASALPETAAPSPGAFQQAFADAVAAGAESILCLTLSSGVSATYQSALTGAESFDQVPVRVIDSLALTMGQGLLALAAAEDAAAGASLDEVATATLERIGRVRIYGAIDQLDHLQRGGRIGGAQALFGSLLSIKPVVQLKDGVVAQESKQRTRSRSLDYLVDKVRADSPVERLAVCDGAAPDIAEFLDKLAKVDIGTERLLVELGPVVGTHAGPATIGLCYLVARGGPGGAR
jgi:DegV family protein with EDD domain